MPVEGELVAVGLVGRAHGLRGEVAVQPWTDDPEARFAAGTVFTAVGAGPGPPGPLTVTAARAHSGRWLVTFAEVGDRSAAEALRGRRLLLPATARRPLSDPDEFYDSDLAGLTVRGPDGAELGRVNEVVHGPAGDYLAVDHDGREHLVPFVRAIVPTVDVAGGVVVVDAPAGLFDL